MLKARQNRRLGKLFNETYGHLVYVAAGIPRGEARKAIRDAVRSKDDVPTDDASAAIATCFRFSDTRHHGIWFQYLRPCPAIIGHEALHSVAFALDAVGMGVLNPHTEEAYAYLMEWTIRGVEDALKQLRKRR